MKHEHFKSFGVLGVTDPTSAPLEEFLASGHITPKSISLVHRTDKYSSTELLIGYVPSKSEHTYSVSAQSLGQVADLASAVEFAAATHEGIVCQHVELDADNNVTVVFLTAKLTAK